MRIALATVGTTGDVLPFARLARALASRGHAVTAVSWPLHERTFSGTEARFLGAGPATSWDDIRATAERAAAEPSPLAQVRVLRDFHLRDAAAHVHQLRSALDGHHLVVLHGIHTLAEAAAREIGASWATAVFDPVLLPSASAPPPGMPPLGPLNRAAWGLLDRLLAREDGPLRSALHEAGIRADGLKLFRSRSPLLHLVACSPRVMAVPPDLAPPAHVTGAWRDPEPTAQLPDSVEGFLAAGPAPLVVTLGSMAPPDATSLAATIVAAARAAGVRMILQSGAAGLTAARAEGLLPIGEVAHEPLFRRVAAVLHHGGAGTTHAVVAAGIPSVVLPQVGDQRYWAMRLERLGVAPPAISPARTSAARLADAIGRAVSDAAMREVARRLGERVAAEDGLASAVGLLERAAG